MFTREMTVELRESTTAHGIKEPNTSAEYLAKDLEQTLKLNEQAKFGGWKTETLDILRENIPFEVYNSEIPKAIKEVTGYDSWQEVVKFVQNDMCLEFFNMALKCCLTNGEPHKENKGFIDGSGIGYVNVYQTRLKETLEQCFDAKYFYKTPRPLVYVQDNFGLDLSSIANFLHPGHWSYPAGHGTKFLTAVEVLGTVFDLTEKTKRTLLIAACVAAHGRSGNLIHFLQDNLAGIDLLDL
jgi:hypothetical protein